MSDEEVKRGEELRDEGIARAGKGSPVFFDLALGAIRRVAEERDVFTTDDVWMELRKTASLESVDVPEPRAMGSAMRVAGSLRYCEAMGSFYLSKRSVCHRRPLRMWSSLLRVK